MAGLNKVQLIGNLGRDPEIRRSNNGNSIASFSIATSETWKDKASGERKEATEWHNIVVFNEHLVKVVEQYLKKGSKVYVEGQMKTRKWEKDGVDRYSTEVVLGNFKGEIVMLGDKAEGGGRPTPDQSDYGSQKSRSAEPRQSLSETLEDDIPF